MFFLFLSHPSEGNNDQSHGSKTFSGSGDNLFLVFKAQCNQAFTQNASGSESQDCILIFYSLKLFFLDWVDENLRSYMFKSSETGAWHCSFCPYFSKLTTNVTRHIEGKHIKTQSYTCDLCQKVCSTRHALNCHKYRYHPGV